MGDCGDLKIKFKRDTSFRNHLFTPESFSHPAKMDAQLLMWIVEGYTKAGETILDPMAGSGTTMLACTLGRNVVLIELEDKFCKMMSTNWEKVRMMPQLGYQMGECKILQGDARQLEGLFDSVITSPPYENQGQGQGNEYHAERMRGSETGLGRGYSKSTKSIGNLKGNTYLSAMLEVYKQCYKVLKEKGLMILVTKNFIRNKQIVNLDKDTIKLCEQAGFTFVEQHYRELPAQSFWRIIYKQKYPDAPEIKYEDVLVFRKP